MKKVKKSKRVFTRTMDVSDLSRRSLNILNSLGGIEGTSEYHRQHGTFLKLNRAGRLVERELTSLINQELITSEYFIAEQDRTNDFSFPFQEMSKIIFDFRITSSAKIVDNIDNEKTSGSPHFLSKSNALTLKNEVIQVYTTLKFGTSQRAQNVLRNIEKEILAKTNEQDIENILKKYCDNNFDFINIPKIGLKCSSDLMRFRQSLMQKIHEILKSDLTESAQFNFDYALYESLKLNYADRRYYSDNEGYEYLRLILYSTYQHLTKRRRDVFKMILFHQGDDVVAIAGKVNLSKERVRQIFKEIENELIPKISLLIKSNISDFPKDLTSQSEAEFFLIPDEINILFYDDNINLKGRFLNLLVASYYYPEFLPLSSLVSDSGKKLRCFKTNLDNILIKSSITSRFDVNNFFTWMDDQMYMFELAEFEYDIDVLAKRYFQEIETNSEIHGLREITNVLKTVKVDSVSLDESTIRRNAKQKLKNDLKGALIEHLSDKVDAVKTSEILDHLRCLNYSIDTIDLLRFLNTNNQTFAPFGVGFWGLKEWSKDGLDTGSLKGSVERILLDSAIPLHVSVIMDKLNNRRKVTEKNLMTNLRINNNANFIFFNCGFIGLARLNYESIWYHLPKFKPSVLRKLRSCGSQQELPRLIDDIIFKYGYPRIHLEFLLSKKES